jgi:hypothetical protein
LNKRGLFVVEFIGNGKSSRAVVRKGQLRFVERIGVAGHVFTILDEANNKIDNASLWMNGHSFNATDRGEIFGTNFSYFFFRLLKIILFIFADILVFLTLFFSSIY